MGKYLTAICLIALAGVWASESKAQPVVTKELTRTLWQEKNLKNAPKRIVLCWFNIWYKTTTFVDDDRRKNSSYSGYSSLRSKLDVSPELALSITDEAVTYFRSVMEGKGYEVLVLDAEKIKNHKNYKKYLKKGEGAGIYNGVALPTTEGEAANDGGLMGAMPTGVNHLWMGPGVNHKEWIKVIKDISKGQEAVHIYISGFVDFVDPKSGNDAGGNVTTLAVSAEPKVRFFNDNRYGQPNVGYDGGTITIESPEIVDNDLSWIAQVEDDNDGNIQYTMDPEQYRRIAASVLKTYVDELIMMYEEVVTSK